MCFHFDQVVINHAEGVVYIIRKLTGQPLHLGKNCLLILNLRIQHEGSLLNSSLCVQKAVILILFLLSQCQTGGSLFS